MPIGADALSGYTFRSRSTASPSRSSGRSAGLSAEIQVIEHKENNPDGLP